MAGKAIPLAEYQSLVGSQIGVSSWIDVDQRRIDAFADATLDRQFIHVDPEAARASLFGGTIAHGFLVLSLLSVMAQECLATIDGTQAGVNYGINSLRFVSPVRSGKRVRGRFVLKAADMRSPSAVQSVLGVTVETEGEAKPALVAEWLVLAHLEAAGGSAACEPPVV
jgi:acyl dehydratase